MPPPLTITGTLHDIFGTADAHAQVVVQLCGFGGQLPRIAGTSLLAKTNQLVVDCPAGTFSFKLWGNDLITPLDTFYTFSLLDDAGNLVQTAAYQLSGAGSVDLSTLTPYVPAPPVVPGTPTVNYLLVTVPYSATPQFDCGLVSGPITFEIVLTGDVTAPTMINLHAGQPVTFNVVQDAAAGHLFAWPSNVKNAAAVDGTTNAINTQSFITRANGNLHATGPMTVS